MAKRDRDGVYQRPDRPGFFISYTDAAGRRRKKRVYAKNITEAREMRTAFLARVQKQKVLGVTDADDTSFANVVNRYLKYQKPRVSADTYERLDSIVEKRLKPAFKGKIGNITRTKISNFVTDRLNEVAA